MITKTKIRIFLNYLLKITVLIVSLFYLYSLLVNKIDAEYFLIYLNSIISSPKFYFFLLLLFLLMIINWGIESKKWNILVKVFYHQKFTEAINGVLLGHTISLFLPNRTGDFIGRILLLPLRYRWKGVYANFVASLSQILVTVVFGIIGFIYFYNAINLVLGNTYLSYLIVSILILFGGFIVLVLLNLQWLKKIASFKFIERFKTASLSLLVFKEFDYNIVSKVFIYSGLRYLIYVTQFFLALYLFDIKLNFIDGFLVISLIYVLITIVPRLAIAEIPIRGSITIFIIDAYYKYAGLPTSSDIESLAFSASTLLWIINIFIPAISGIWVFLNKKLVTIPPLRHQDTKNKVE